VATSPTQLLSAPHQWETVMEDAVDGQEEAIARAERFLGHWSSHAV
jgi:hypothetical protein